MNHSDYYENDLKDPEVLVVRPKGTKRQSALAYCKWAAGDWEANFYAWTDTHRGQCKKHLKQLESNASWFKWRAPKIDKRAAAANNQARNDKKPRRRKKAA